MGAECRKARLIANLILTSVTLATVLLFSLGASAADGSVETRLERIPSEVRSHFGQRLDTTRSSELQGIIIVPASERLLIQVYQVSSAEGAEPQVALWVRDLDSFRTIKVVETPGTLGGAILYTTEDSAGRRLFITDVTGVPGGIGGFISLDLSGLKAKTIAYGGELIGAAGMTYIPETGLLYGVQGTSCLGATGCPGALNLVYAIDADDGQLVFRRTLRGCRGTAPVEFAATTDPALRVVAAKDSSNVLKIHIPCWLRQGVSGVVIAGATESDSSERFVPGPPAMSAFHADQQTSRLVFIGRPGAGQQEEGFVYDAKAAAFVGALPLSKTTVAGRENSSYGIDPTTGVLFGMSKSNGLISSAIRLDPIPQPERYQGYRGNFASARIWYDPQQSRVFVLGDLKNDPLERETTYDVVRIPKPLSVPEALDPDRNTADIPEGVNTQVSYAANGSAYGARVLLARGVQGAIPTTGDSINLPSSLQRDAIPNKCGFVDRTLVFASIGSPQGPASLTDTGVSGRTVEFDADEATKIDLETPSRCDQMLVPGLSVAELLGIETGIYDNPTVKETGFAAALDENAGSPWGYAPAECSGDDSSVSKRRPGAHDLGSSSVTCRSAQESLSADSTGRVDLDGLSVARTETTVRIKRVPGQGATVETTSIARGVIIGIFDDDGDQTGQVAIGEIKTVATSKAGGRPGTARASFTRQISGLLYPGVSSPQACSNKDCEERLTRLNDLFAGRAEFRFPSPDPSICRSLDSKGDCLGTPKGAQAGVLKSEFRRASDKAMSGDASRELPGLEILVYNDNQHLGRARQLLQLAGVQASTSYNISILEEGFGFGPISDFESFSFEEFAVPEIPPLGVQESPGLFKRFFRKVIKPIADGLLLFFASPREAARAATAWVLLAAPVIMALRRRRLLDLHRST